MAPRRISTLLLGLFASMLVLFAAVSPAFAQTEGRDSETGFVQCTSTFPASGSTEDAVGGSCDLCDVMQLVNNATFYAVSMVMLVATAFVLVSGFLYLTSGGDEHRISQAKNSLKFAVVGMIIALLAGIIVKTIMFRIFPGQNPGLGTFTCTLEAAPPAPGAPGTGEPGTGEPPSTEPPTTPGEELTHAEALNRLDPDISVVSSGNCSAQNNPNCTSLDGVKESTIASVNIFQNNSPGCDVVITGGTETGHSSGHTNGYKLDLRHNSCVDTYIQSFTPISDGPNGWKRWQDQYGNVYMAETGSDPHWDIDFRGFNSTY